MTLVLSLRAIHGKQIHESSICLEFHVNPKFLIATDRYSDATLVQ